VFIATTAARLAIHPAGGVGRALSLLGAVALFIWAVLEIVRGDSPFRRVLGAVVLVFMIVSAVTR
jgi:hypothetical protein